MKKKDNKIKIFNICFFLLILILTFIFIFKNNDITLIIKNLKKVNLKYIVIAILFMFIYISCEGINIKRVLKNLGNKITYISSYKYAFIGFFFSAITPSSTGGDPAQLYFMTKDKIPVSHSALALLVELTSFQLMTCILSLIGLIYNFNLLFTTTGNLKYLIILGLTFNITYLVILIIMIFSKKLALILVKLISKILNFFHYKKTENFYNKALNHIEEYHKCSIYLKNNKKILLKVILTTLVEIIVYHSIPYLISLSFGLNNINPVTLITLSGVLFTTASFIPLPGSMGVSEGSFVIIYKMFFPRQILGSAMLITRGINYYLFTIISGLIVLIFTIYSKLKKTLKTKPAN